MRKKSGQLGAWLVTSVLAFLTFLVLMMKKSNPKSTQGNDGNIDWDIIRGSEFSQLTPFVIAQAKHETDNFKSNLARNHNNIFGMQKVRKRKNFQNGEVIAEGGKPFGTYKSKNDAVRDFLEYLRMWKKKPFPRTVSSASAYARALKDRGYFGDLLSNYVNGIERWIA